LDEIRDESGARRTGNQGAVVQAAREKARAFLRVGEDFIWNATNLNREIRAQVIDLLAAYNACVRIVYVEASRDMLFAQNRSRKGAVSRKGNREDDGPVGSAGYDGSPPGRAVDRWRVSGPT
jgi:predicted kinase